MRSRVQILSPQHFFSTNVSLILLTIINTYLLGREAKITIFPGQLYRIFDLFESISIWADSGNRTRVFSLAKRNFTIRPYPHFFVLDTQYVPTYMIYNRILFVQCRDTYSLRNDSNYFFNCILFIQEV